MKAIIKYPGSKWSIADWIINFFPKIQITPAGGIFFCGGNLEKLTNKEIEEELTERNESNNKVPRK